jgi:hypothetical protein
MLIILVMAALTSFQIFTRYRTQLTKIEIAHEQLRAKAAPETLDNLSELLVQNFRTLNSFYSENLTQYRTSSFASIAIAVLGFVVIISGVLIAIVGQSVTVGTVSSVAGIVGEAAAMLFFRQNRTFQLQMEASLQKLVSSQYLMTSIALARELTPQAKEAEVARINGHLRELMNALHDIHGVERRPERLSEIARPAGAS